MNAIILVTAALFVFLRYRVLRRHLLKRRMYRDLDRIFPRRPFVWAVVLFLLAGCGGHANLTSQNTTGAADPPSSSSPGTGSNPGVGSGSGGGGTPAGGDPQIIEAVGCQNNLPAPAQYQPFSCQLKLPIAGGDAIDAIFWTNSDVTNAITTLKVSDANGTQYLSVVSVPRVGSTNDTIWISSGVSTLASPSLNVVVDPGIANPTTGNSITIRDLVLVHTRGGNAKFKSVVSSGCSAPPTPTPGPCLPVQAPALTPATNDLVIVVALSDSHILNAQSFSAPYSFLWASADAGANGYFVVGAYNAVSASPIQPVLAVDQSQLNTNFGWSYSALEASFN